MTKSEKREAMVDLHKHISLRLVQIGGVASNYGLESITNFTLIARDPNNDNMCLVVTNEDSEGLRKATQVALVNATITEVEAEVR